MSRIQPCQNPSNAAQKVLEGIQQKMGSVKNIFQTMAHSAAVLGAYTGQAQALQNTSISAQLREQIALAVAGFHGCDYCSSAHTLIGEKTGLSRNEMMMNLAGKSADDKAKAALIFVIKLLESRANVSDADVKTLKDAGYTDGEVLEIVTVTTFNIFTNYFNHVADTEVDFPFVSSKSDDKAA